MIRLCCVVDETIYRSRGNVYDALKLNVNRAYNEVPNFEPFFYDLIIDAMKIKITMLNIMLRDTVKRDM